MKDKLNIIRNQIVDIALIFASVLGVITYLLSLYKAFEVGFQMSFFTDFIAVTTILVITIYRRRIPVKIKGLVILGALFLVTFVDIIQLGLLSANKVFIVLIPFFSLTIFTVRQTVYVFILSIVIFILIGALFITGNNPMLAEGENHILETNAWIINGMILIISTLVTLLITQRFNSAYLDFFKDITRKNKELSDSERNYREIFNGSTDGIFIHAIDGKVVDVNESMLKMYGYDNFKEVQEIPFDDLCAGTAEYNAEVAGKLLKKALNKGMQVFDWHARKKNGKLFWVEVALKPVKIGNNDRILAIVRDNNEKKELSLQLENYRDKLEELVRKRTKALNQSNSELQIANELLINQKEELTLTLDKLKNTQEKMIHQEKMASLGILTSGVGHEINNPLNFIQAGIYSIESFFEDFEDCNEICDHKDQLIKITESMQIGVDRVNNIVSGLNHFSRQSSNYNENCDIHTIIENCLVILNNQYKHRIEINKEFAEEDFIIRGNEGKLHQVFINILINSIHAIKDKGEITIRSERINNHILVKVIDTGTGISKEHISKIFDPFFTTKEAGKGTGLGLSISYGIIKEHGGLLNYKSENGNGTEAIIQLPLNEHHE
jgi:PAS domain S-box-containing protein